ncbi:hypothetical protein QYM36_007533 [Artemia franciscana]|uniref:Uncharacterized protein n=1 Tax=Artemia franciscana TaxID=6661 RepID=A0AA88ICJ8_ARTSF|nr:hypothetical protein QYM36_007533 [Artemia franciscana]
MQPTNKDGLLKNQQEMMLLEKIDVNEVCIKQFEYLLNWPPPEDEPDISDTSSSPYISAGIYILRVTSWKQRTVPPLQMVLRP